MVAKRKMAQKGEYHDQQSTEAVEHSRHREGKIMDAIKPKVFKELYEYRAGSGDNARLYLYMYSVEDEQAHADSTAEEVFAYELYRVEADDAVRYLEGGLLPDGADPAASRAEIEQDIAPRDFEGFAPGTRIDPVYGETLRERSAAAAPAAACPIGSQPAAVAEEPEKHEGFFDFLARVLPRGT